MKKNLIIWIYLAVCLCFAGCGNIEKVEFLGSDKARLQECYIYHEGEKEEVLPLEAGGLLNIISELVDETKSYWDVFLGYELLKNSDELRDKSEEKISEGKYYIWLQFDQPPVDIEYGDGEEAGIDESDKFIVEIDQKDGGIILNYNLGIDEGNIGFYQLGTMGMHYEIDYFLRKLEKWEANKGDETVKDQDILIDTEGEDAKLKAEKVEFLGSDRAWLQECYIYHEGGKEEILLSEAGGLLKIISEFINETKSDWHKDLETLELKNSDELKDMSGEKYYIWLQFYETPVGHLEYGDGEFTFTGKGDKLIMEIDLEKGEFFMNYNQNDNEDNIEFSSCGMEGKQDEIESFLERYEEWRANK